MYARWLKAAVLLVVALAAAFWGGLNARRSWQTADQSVVEGLMIPTANLDIGEVWEQEDFVWKLPIRNLSGHTIEIFRFLTSCDCTAVEPPKLSIQPGETTTVQLTIDLTHRSAVETGLVQRTIAISLKPVTTRDLSGSRGWQIHGTIRNSVTLNVNSVHFGDQPVHGQPAITRRVLAKVHVQCQDLEVTLNPQVATVTIKRHPQNPERFEITIAVNPELPPGYFQTNAKISAVAPGGKREWGALLPIVGEMQSEVRLLPARVILPPLPIGETAEAIVTLQAPFGTKVAFDHIEIDDPGLRIEPIGIDGIPAGRAYRFLQQVVKEGEHTSMARLYVRKPDQKTLVLTVEVRYRGESMKQTAKKTSQEREP